MFNCEVVYYLGITLCGLSRQDITPSFKPGVLKIINLTFEQVQDIAIGVNTSRGYSLVREK